MNELNEINSERKCKGYCADGVGNKSCGSRCRNNDYINSLIKPKDALYSEVPNHVKPSFINETINNDIEYIRTNYKDDIESIMKNFY